jgi:uncharacterized glyoxalase superfamily protein PhnB
MTDMTSMIPMLVCADIAATHDYLVDVFGFEAGDVVRDGDGNPVHGELRGGDGTIWLHAVSPAHELASPRGMAEQHGGLLVFVDDVDKHFAKAKQAGAKIDSEPRDQEYGQREYGARDPEGHRFWFATRL